MRLDGYKIIALPVLTLPPADRVNTVLAGPWIVDPGSDDVDAVIAAVDQPPAGIVLTHRHRDHISGAAPLAARLRCPVLAHAITAQELAGRLHVDRLIADGDELPLGNERSLRVLHTPGHARGHIVLHEVAMGVMVVGDMVAGEGSIVIAAPDGNVRDYLASLRRMRALTPTALIPAHGPVVGIEKLDEYIAHRLKREADILAAVRAGEESLPEIVAVVYRGTPALLLPWAERSAATHLEKLIEDGLVTRDGERYSAV